MDNETGQEAFRNRKRKLEQSDIISLSPENLEIPKKRIKRMLGEPSGAINTKLSFKQAENKPRRQEIITSSAPVKLEESKAGPLPIRVL